jgi:hypothetical protein
MQTISLKLPDDLLAELEREAKASHGSALGFTAFDFSDKLIAESLGSSSPIGASRLPAGDRRTGST